MGRRLTPGRSAPVCILLALHMAFLLKEATPKLRGSPFHEQKQKTSGFPEESRRAARLAMQLLPQKEEKEV